MIFSNDSGGVTCYSKPHLAPVRTRTSLQTGVYYSVVFDYIYTRHQTFAFHTLTHLAPVFRLVCSIWQSLTALCIIAEVGV